MLEIIKLLGGATVLIGAAGWLATKFIENRLNREIEAYKARLKAESDTEIENLKSRLQVAAKEREIAVSWLHQKRATAIESLYSSLADLQHAARVVLDTLSPRNPADIRKFSSDAVKKLHQTYGAYLKAKIFLSPLTCEKIEKVLRGIQGSVVMYDLYLGNYDDHELNTLTDVKDIAWKDIQAVVPAALEELESEFRLVLGVENS
ncbi:hypothetical protein [Chromohalobacter israelensis]|uniref:hypothetical protein n=1 Tax=Chromohalobacter israelensis TaxID=141390 RepID=UPI0015C4B157|nr:hypothetical protein [Chromohalobacter salexigens]